MYFHARTFGVASASRRRDEFEILVVVIHLGWGWGRLGCLPLRRCRGSGSRCFPFFFFVLIVGVDIYNAIRLLVDGVAREVRVEVSHVRRSEDVLVLR